MAAWSEPNPQLQPVARLTERVQLRVDEQRGAWARVTGSNNWTGWVDARRLLPMGAAGAAATPVSPAAVAPAAATAAARPGVQIGGLSIRLLTAIGAVIAGISVLLPWLSPPGGGGSSNAFDVPFPFLWDYTAGGDFRLGIVVIILAVLGLAVAVFRQLSPRLAAALGIVTLVAGVMFIIQVSRAISDSMGLGFGDAIGDWVGFGTWLTIGGGVLMLVGGLTDR
jgi:hypothetical protein